MVIKTYFRLIAEQARIENRFLKFFFRSLKKKLARVRKRYGFGSLLINSDNFDHFKPLFSLTVELSVK